jgi:hypothetical protein
MRRVDEHNCRHQVSGHAMNAFVQPVALHVRCSWSHSTALRKEFLLHVSAVPQSRPRRAAALVTTPSCNLVRPPRAQSSWGASLLSLPRSRVLSNVWPQIVTSFAVSSSVVLAHLFARSYIEIPALSTTPHQFIASALSLVIVFRTNAACK